MYNSPMTIRQVWPEDISALIAIEQQAFAVHEQLSPAILQAAVEKLAATFLVVTFEQQVVAFLLGVPTTEPVVTDDLFVSLAPAQPIGGHLALLSLAVAPDFQKQGLGTLLLAAMKTLAVQQQRQGIALTCHEALIGFYETNGFVDGGLSASQFGGEIWYDMYWSNVSVSSAVTCAWDEEK